MPSSAVILKTGSVHRILLISRWGTADWSEGISAELEEEIQAALTALLPGSGVLGKAQEFFAKSRTDHSIMTIGLPHELFNEVRRVLIHESMSMTGTT